MKSEGERRKKKPADKPKILRYPIACLLLPSCLLHVPPSAFRLPPSDFRLLRLRSRAPDHSRPPRHVLPDVRGKLLGRAAKRFDALGGEHVPDVGLRE